MKTICAEDLLEKIKIEAAYEDTIPVKKVKEIVKDMPDFIGLDWNPLETDNRPPEDKALMVSFSNFAVPKTGFYKDGVFYQYIDGDRRPFRDSGYVVNAWCIAPQSYDPNRRIEEDDDEGEDKWRTLRK